MRALAVLDVGKTNVKLAALDAEGRVIAERRRPNAVRAPPPYPHFDVDAIWQWLLAELSALAHAYRIDAIVTTTHGAAAALVDESALVLPILDYEHALPEDLSATYRALCDPYALTYSPTLPCGLNLGRQLHWLATAFPAAFAKARHILLYPQYWAWRMSGVAASERTSLGCHTDLWRPEQSAFSGLVARMAWERLLPPMQPAWRSLGPILPAIAAQTRLPEACEILCGIHDSNASLLRHIAIRSRIEPATVVSTGTWVIVAAIGGSLQRLDDRCDMLANVDVFGRSTPCARFMGGREFATLNALQAKGCTDVDLANLIDRRIFALPAFADAGGPFPGHRGRIVGELANAAAHFALASLYCALVTDHCLTALDARGDIVIEGSFTANPHYAAVLAALRPQSRVYVSDDAAGTVRGAFVLSGWHHATEVSPGVAVSPFTGADLVGYRDAWIARIAQQIDHKL